jgi:hypothetical protein
LFTVVRCRIGNQSSVNEWRLTHNTRVVREDQPDAEPACIHFAVRGLGISYHTGASVTLQNANGINSVAVQCVETTVRVAKDSKPWSGMTRVIEAFEQPFLDNRMDSVGACL